MIFAIPLVSVIILTSFTLGESESTAEERIEAFEDGIFEMYCDIGLQDEGLSLEAFQNAMIGYYNLKDRGKLKNPNILSVIDFTQSCNELRFYTVNLETRKLIFRELVAHGENTGVEYARYFSNNNKSHQSSLGFFVTGETYTGRRGFSLKLDGMEWGINSNVRARGVVIHGAEYVDERYITKGGRIGRSWGCPAMGNDVYKQVIEVIKEGTCVFAWYPDKVYLKYTGMLNKDQAAEAFFQQRF